jgi:hypothetical protein
MYEHPFSWRDWCIDEIPVSFFILILAWTLASSHILHKNILKHAVHIGENVTVNDNTLPILPTLSVGYKYLLSTQTQP